ncbi:MAG: TFIIB-type zinc ribbon-containing protein [Promethearchaeota archaeon]
MSKKDVRYSNIKCPFCAGTVAIDRRHGYMVCSECGMVIKDEDFKRNVIKKRELKTQKELNDGYPINRDWNLRQKIKKAFKH